MHLLERYFSAVQSKSPFPFHLSTLIPIPLSRHFAFLRHSDLCSKNLSIPVSYHTIAAAPLLFSFTSLRLHLLRHLHFSPALRPEPSCPPKFSFLKIPHPLFPSTRPCPPLSIALTGNLLLVSIGTQPQLAKLHGSFYSIYASIANIFLCQSERLDIMLYHVSPALLQSSGDI